MTEREDFHLPGQHEQQDHNWREGGGSSPVSGGGASEGHKYVDLPRKIREDPIQERKKVESYPNASAARAARASIHKDLTGRRGYTLIASHPQEGDVYRKDDGKVTKEVRVEPSYGADRDAHGKVLHINEAYYEQGIRRADSERPVPLRTKFAMDFAKLEGAEIFASGKWNGLDFSDEDLDKIVQSFEFFELGGRVPLKLGHNDEQPLTDGQPALGWVSRIWREGSKLKADFTDMPTAIYDLIKRGAYKFVSVELLRDVIAGTRTVPLVLDAVALLGADLPAVGTLKDLQALTMSRRLEGRERLTFTQAFINSGDVKTMADEDTKVAMDELRRELAEAKARAAQNEERFTKLDTETKAAKVAAHRKSIVDMLEDAVRSKKIQPSVRERFMRRFKIETDDAGVMLIPLSDVESYIRENPNPFLKNLNVTNGGDPDEIPAGGLPDRELMARARKLCRDRGKNPENWEDLKAAGVAIMKSDPQLAERYRSLPDDHADGKYSM